MMFTHQSKIALSLAGRLLATRMYLRIDLASLDLIVTFSNLSTSSGTAAVGERWWFTNDFAITGKQKTRAAEMWLRGKSVQVAVFERLKMWAFIWKCSDLNLQISKEEYEIEGKMMRSLWLLLMCSCRFQPKTKNWYRNAEICGRALQIEKGKWHGVNNRSALIIFRVDVFDWINVTADVILMAISVILSKNKKKSKRSNYFWIFLINWIYWEAAVNYISW